MKPSPALRLSLLYVGVSLLWIWGSDRLVLSWSPSSSGAVQTIKDALFVLVTGLALYFWVSGDMRRLRRANRNLASGNLQALRVLVSVMDMRHKETGSHSDRVMRMAVGLGRLAGIKGRALRDLGFGALLHDIGKLALPDAILTKPDKLDREEMRVMREHPRIGYELLQRVDFLRKAGDIPYCHHERWDGQGYPRGLRGEEIPLAARVFSVVDIWDALCSPRVYKPAWPEDEVRMYLEEVAGTQLDPRLVRLFLDNLDDLKHQTMELPD